ncbi:MAG TPA: YdjY domain-containing protein, partial [Planctomycetota bacterium]|nr:YdjY domain-containing protein [Planctomycetota bacterium]
METRRSRAALVGFCLVLALVAAVFVMRSHAATQAAPGGAPAPQDPENAQKADPRLVVQPFAEPEIVLNDKVSQRPDFVAQLPTGNGFIFERRDDKGKKIGGVVVPGVVLVTRGLVELFGCGEGGKEHETILRLECDVQSLDLALTSAGLKRGRLPKKADITEPGQGSRVLVLVQWTGEDGKSLTYRSEDLIVSTRRQSPMPRVGWTYVGAWAEVPDPTSPKGEKKHKVLAAANSRSYVTTFRDHTALLDNPLEEAIDDT